MKEDSWFLLIGLGFTIVVLSFGILLTKLFITRIVYLWQSGNHLTPICISAAIFGLILLTVALCIRPE